MTNSQIHESQPVLTTGASLDNANVAAILLHGRGGTAQSMIGLAGQLPQDTIAYLAPQAAHQTWYPNSGFLPIEANEPYVSSAFQTITNLIARITEAGIPTDKIVLGGFSQGACLASEYVARHPQRYGGLLALSGALMGPPDAPRDYAGSLDGMPVFIAGSDRDPWVTEHQLRLTGDVLQGLGAAVEIAITPGADHAIRPPEIAHINTMLASL